MLHTLKKGNTNDPVVGKNVSVVSKFRITLPDRVIKTGLLRVAGIKGISPLNSVRFVKRHMIDNLANHVIYYPAPISLTYAWSFGSLAGVSLVIQMISGFFLAMFYTPHVELAFSSVEFIMRDVKHGWLLRYIHANGASMFFIVVYLHIVRGLYYGSYMAPRQSLWCSGVALFLLMMATAFTGYVLPWGQMSFWGATVITSMVTAIPLVGQCCIDWVWGGHVIGDPTLKRIYMIHLLLPLIITAVTFTHLSLLHIAGSNSPIGSDTGVDDVPFYPYFVSKDIFAFSFYLLVFGFFVLYCPNFLNHPDNCIPADPTETPRHVVPEWYFLPFYAILRSIPHKGLGILAMLGSILILFTIPYTYYSFIRSTTYRPLFKFFFWGFVADFCLLTYVGQCPVRDSFIIFGQVFTGLYYFFFIVCIPILGRIEHFLGSYRR